jgi:hypothetical protein
MPTLKGWEAEQRRRDGIPDKVRRVLRGAARAGAAVIADDAKLRVASDAVRNGVVVGRATEREGTISVRIRVKDGWAKSLGLWLEYGTSAHFISVDPNFSEGRTAGRTNRLEAEAAKSGTAGPARSLIIKGKPVGATVYHPGARAEPWLRPARDTKASEAVTAAQEHIYARLRGNGPVANGDDE